MHPAPARGRRPSSRALVAFVALVVLSFPIADTARAASIRAVLDGPVAAGDAFAMELYLDLAEGEEASVFEGHFDLLGQDSVTDIELTPGGDTWGSSFGNIVDSQAGLSLTSGNTGGSRKVGTLSGIWSGEGAFGVALAPGTFAQKDLFAPPFVESILLDTQPGTLLARLGDPDAILRKSEPAPEPDPPDPDPAPEPAPEPEPDPGPKAEPEPEPDPACVETEPAEPAACIPGFEQTTPAMRTSARFFQRPLFFFAADDGIHGEELWLSDGTAEGTRMLLDIAPGPDASRPRELMEADGLVFFQADDGVHGPELWRSDGTPEGTELVADLLPGPEGAAPQNLRGLRGALLFERCESGTCETWVSDGSGECTEPVQDLAARLCTIAQPISAIRETSILFVGNVGHSGGVAEDDDEVATTGGEKTVIVTGSSDTGTLGNVVLLGEDIAQVAQDGPSLSFGIVVDVDSDGDVTETDFDGVPDAFDNCPHAPNPHQDDHDGDGRGDACACGDFNRDGRVDTTDARLITRCAAGEIDCLGLCDTDGDDLCGPEDAVRVQRYAVGQLDASALRCAEQP